MSTPRSFHGNLGRVALRDDLEEILADGDAAVPGLDRLIQVAENRVVLQQMGQRLGVGQIVDRDEIDVRLLLEGRAHDVAADAAEPVDTDLDCHECSNPGQLVGPIN